MQGSLPSITAYLSVNKMVRFFYLLDTVSPPDALPEIVVKKGQKPKESKEDGDAHAGENDSYSSSSSSSTLSSDASTEDSAPSTTSATTTASAGTGNTSLFATQNARPLVIAPEEERDIRIDEAWMRERMEEVLVRLHDQRGVNVFKYMEAWRLYKKRLVFKLSTYTNTNYTLRI